MIRISENITIEEWEVSESFSLSSGPGGQNVNKVATAVLLRFYAEASPHLSPTVKRRLKLLAGNRWTQDGSLLIRAEKFRSQSRNRELAREKLISLVQEALRTPKRRIPTRPSFASKKRRIEGKKQRGQVKKMRSKNPFDE